MSEDNGWLIQANVKHGRLDDRGVPIHLTNFRGITAQDVADQISDAIDKKIGELCDEYAALAALQSTFQTEQVGTNSAGGELCKGHNLPRKHQTGVKNGKKWAAWFCTAPKEAGQCAPQWVD